MRGQKTAPELIEQAKALYLVKDSISEVARALGIPRKTAEEIIKRDDEFAELRRQQKRKLILKANQKAEELLDEIDPKKAKSLTELSTTYGILLDKNTALAGEQFKSNSVSVNLGDNRQVIFEVSPNLKQVIDRIQSDVKKKV